MKLRLPLLGAVFLALSSSLSALPLRVLAWDEAVASRPFAIGGGGNEATELKGLHPLSRSLPVNVTVGESPPTLRALDRLDDKGVAASDPISIPAGVKRPLALLMPDPKAATGIRTIILEDDSVGFTWGDIRIINATGRELLFKCETKVMQLAAGWTPADHSPGGQRRNMEVMFALKSDPKKILFSSIWEHRDDQRQLVFIIPNRTPGESPLDFKFILENKVDAAAPRPEQE